MKSFKQFLKEARFELPGMDREWDAEREFGPGGLGDPDSSSAPKELGFPTRDMFEKNEAHTSHVSWLTIDHRKPDIELPYNHPRFSFLKNQPIVISSRVDPQSRLIEYVFRHGNTRKVLGRATTKVHDDLYDPLYDDYKGTPNFTPGSVEILPQRSGESLVPSQMFHLIHAHRNTKIGDLPQRLNGPHDTMAVKDFHDYHLDQIINVANRPKTPPPDDFEDGGYWGPGDGDTPIIPY